LQPTGVKVALRDFVQTRFVNRHLAAQQALNLQFVDVDAQHVVAGRRRSRPL